MTSVAGPVHRPSALRFGTSKISLHQAGRERATGEIVSCYLRDPDGNLVELSNYQHPQP